MVIEEVARNLLQAAILKYSCGPGLKCGHPSSSGPIGISSVWSDNCSLELDCSCAPLSKFDANPTGGLKVVTVVMEENPIVHDVQRVLNSKQVGVVVRRLRGDANKKVFCTYKSCTDGFVVRIHVWSKYFIFIIIKITAQ